MSENGSNDADKRPSVYGKATGEKGSVEVTVQGAEGETADDVMEKLPEAVEHMASTQEALQEQDGPERGVQ